MAFLKGHKINLGRKINPKVKMICSICKEEFYDYISNNRKFCSKKCANKKLGMRMLGISFVKGKHWKTKPRTEEMKDLNRRRIIERYKSGEKLGFQKGKDHWAWKGGVCKENYSLRRGKEFKKWRMDVFKRDNYTCQECKVRGGILHPHHIKPFALFPDVRFSVDNGKTLCINCHKRTSSWGNNKIKLIR